MGPQADNLAPALEFREGLRARLLALGFDEVRFAEASAVLLPALRSWLDAGHQADMAWMERTAERRLDPGSIIPGARTVIALGVTTWSEDPPADAARPAWARYAQFEDYHDTIGPALDRAVEVLAEATGTLPTDSRPYVDTGPVLEREWARRAGVGFVGRNAMLISRAHGNWLMLGAIITRAEIPADEPIKAGGSGVGQLCGSCRRCIDACPTDAFPAPGVLDARRCISYQTIENRGFIPRALRPGIGNRVFGCDTCLDVCPWNRFARSGREMLLVPKAGLRVMDLASLLELTPAAFAARFRRTPVKRLKLRGLLRNACIVAGNSGDRSLVDRLVALASHPEPIVRGHAVWAVYRLAGRAEGEHRLAAARKAEGDASVLEEHRAAGDLA
jgi:epoxyqueuosine reductase